MTREDTYYFIHCSSLSFESFLSPTPCNFRNWDWETLGWHKYRASWRLPCLHMESIYLRKEANIKERRSQRWRSTGSKVPNHSLQEFCDYIKVIRSYKTTEDNQLGDKYDHIFTQDHFNDTVEHSLKRK